MKVGEIGAAWAGCFRENGVLVHLDISFNQIDFEETKLIKETLPLNQTLVGLHFQGNKGPQELFAGKIDSYGFMRKFDTVWTLGNDIAL
jgi:hypothetical protein